MHTRHPAGSSHMSEAFTKKSDKNYITPVGLQRLRDELRFLLGRERPAVTQVVAWAASNGDRSDNADLGYPFNRSKLRGWVTLVLARTIRSPWASSRPGSGPMRTA